MIIRGFFHKIKFHFISTSKLRIFFHYILLVFLCFFSNFSLHGQQDALVINEDYIEKDTTSNILGLTSRYSYYRLTTDYAGGREMTFERKDIALGFTAKIKNFMITVEIPIFDVTGSNFSPQLLEFDIEAFPKSYFIKANFQYVSAFDNFSTFLTSPSQITKNDSKLFSINLWGAYVFQEEDKISLQAAYGFIDRQKKAAGSWLAFMFMDYNAFYSELSGISEEDERFTNSIQLDRGRFGLGGGYTISVPFNRLSWNGLLGLGTELTSTRVLSGGRFTPFANNGLNAKLIMKSSVVYNFKSGYYISTMGEFNPDFNNNSDFMLNRDFWLAQLYIGKKF